MKPTAPTDPLESLDFLPVRIGEALAFLGGGLTDEQYPKWVQNVGGDLARQLLPPGWLESARADRTSFVEGFLVGALAVTDLARIPTETPPDELAHIQRIANTGLLPVDIPKELTRLTPKRIMRSARKDVAASLSKPAAARLAFFRGLILGLDPAKAITSAVESFTKKVDRDAAVLRLYLWLRWPELQELNSIPEAHTKCRRAFATIKREHVVGSEAAFRRFCNRIGLTYQHKQRAKREGQKAVCKLSGDKNVC